VIIITLRQQDDALLMGSNRTIYRAGDRDVCDTQGRLKSLGRG